MAINLVNDNISTIEIQGKKYNIKAIPFHGTAAEWENNNYIPKDGEIIIYDIDENYNYKRIKIGNGTDIVSVLPFLDEDIASRILALETWSQEIEEKIAYIDYETKEDAQDKLTEAKAYTDFKTSTLASTSSVNTTINTHNTSTSAHEDIRALIDGLTTRLNTVANSDDTTLDQMSEIVSYIKSNKSLIDNITTNKVNFSDIVDNLTTNVSSKPLSAAQGVALKALIDAIEVPTKISDLTNDMAVLYTSQSLTESQKAQARANLGITSTGSSEDSSNLLIGSIDDITPLEVKQALEAGKFVILSDAGLYYTNFELIGGLSVSAYAFGYGASGCAIYQLYGETTWNISEKKNLIISDSLILDIESGGTGQASIEDTTYTTPRYRASALVSAETSPTTNGVINWIYE